MPWNTGLQSPQLDIAGYAGTYLRVVAGPGTGKSFALMRRVTRLLEEGVTPETILAVTFTRTAAADLVDSLAQLGAPGATHVAAKTLHSISFSLLSRTAVFQSLGRTSRPLMDHERDTLICDLAASFGGKRAVEKLIAAFEADWATLQHMATGWPTDPTHQAFSQALTNWLIFHRAMLIGEVVPLALSFITNNPAHPDIPVYDHVVVDEYQDLNKADQALIDAIAASAAVTVVGDEDQSIYGFRFANPEGIIQYPQTHLPTHDEVLNVCRRCPQTVVSMANNLIQRNTRLAPKVLNPYTQNGPGTVYRVQHASVQDEIATLAAYIDSYLAAHPTIAAGDVLVLANRRLIGNGVRDALNALATQRGRTWEAQSFYFEDALPETDAAEGFALLTILVDAEDRAALRYWLAEGHQTCHANTYARIRSHSEQTGASPRAILEQLSTGSLTLPYSAGLVARFEALVLRLSGLPALTIQQLIDNLFPAGNAATLSVRQAATTAALTATTAEELLNGMRTLITQPELPGRQGNAIRIMSLHKSKGLTASVVVMAGCMNGIIPVIDFDAPVGEQNRQRQEQRRLFFVGLTRSTDTLVLSNSVAMPRADALRMGLRVTWNSGPNTPLQASSFLAELGPQAPATITGVNWRMQLGF